MVNVGPFGLDIHNRVFAVSGLLVVAFVVLAAGLSEPGRADVHRDAWLADLERSTGSSSAPATSSCWCASAWRSRRWARCAWAATEATPDYTYLGWFSMLFAAGMGIGLMLFGVSEPLSHFGSASAAPRWRTACAPTGRRSVGLLAMPMQPPA